MTRKLSWRLLACCAVLLPAFAPSSHAEPGSRSLDRFDDVSKWQAASYPGTNLAIVPDAGHEGGGMRLDFDFHGARGYVLARRDLRARLPENWAIHFWMRAAAPTNTFEFKLVDTKGQTVWWRVQRDFEFPLGWQRITIRKSQLAFAWGPNPKEPLREIGAIEIAISAGTGGHGSIWIDDLQIEERETTDLRALRPRIRASDGGDARAVFDGKPETTWRGEADSGDPWVELDFGRTVEYGGLVIDWDDAGAPPAFRLLVSDDGNAWASAWESGPTGGSRSYLPLPDEESRHLRLELLAGTGHGIRELRLQPYSFSETPNDFFKAIAGEAPRGAYPRYLLGQQSYWTVVGVDAGASKALLDEDGRLEVPTGSFSIEPFLRIDDDLVTWADAQKTQQLAEGQLPVPTVTWRVGDFALDVTAFAAGSPGRSTLYARYRVENLSDLPRKASLFLALRPFQVNPPWQSQLKVGGVTSVEQIARRGRGISVDRQQTVVPLTPPEAFGAMSFEEGDLVEWLRQDRVPTAEIVSDRLGWASGVLRYDLELPESDTREVWIAVPMESAVEPPELAYEDETAAAAHLQDTLRFWRQRLARMPIRLPESGARTTRTLNATLAYILVNRNGPAIQPGARNYARAWIRDGALTAAALLEMGYSDEVREFLRWYARYQYDDGRIPCCIDSRGADPIAEHDSNGEFIYAITSYYRHTRDRAFLEEMWPKVVRAVAYIRFLREQTMSTSLDGRPPSATWGIAPPSISHEGYSSRPVHSYWDDFFLLRGLKDAVTIARELGDEEHAESFTELRDGFRIDLYASISRAGELHQIDFIPGSVELGDLDPTSTSIAVSPGDELQHLPQAQLQRTFERYFSHFLERRDGAIEWQSYTPYELRNVGTLIRLGHKKLALEALDFFLADQRPVGWLEWAEVVWRNPREPAFIGDMPHTWVGSGYIRSVRSLFVYEREADRALVIGAGLPRVWIDTAPGVAVDRLPTHYGSISYSARRDSAGRVRISIYGDLHEPPERIEVVSPYDEPLTGVSVDGQEIAEFAPDRVQIQSLPADVVFRY